MERDEFEQLTRGDVVQHLRNGESYVIHDRVVDRGEWLRFIAIRTVTVSNPREWKLIPPEELR